MNGTLKILAVTAVVLVFSALPLSAQQGGRGPMDPGGIARILEEAGCPLTAEQMTQFRGFREQRAGEFNSILTDEQEDALAAAREQAKEARQARVETRRDLTQARHDSLRVRLERVRQAEIARIATVLEEAGCPLTQEQLDRLNEPAGAQPGRTARLAEILTDAQERALADFRKEQRSMVRQHRQDRVRDRIEEAQARVSERIAQVLENAGQPLTPEQASALEALEYGPGLVAEISEILTDTQEQALRNARVPLLERLRNMQRPMRGHLRPPMQPETPLPAQTGTDEGAGKAANVEEPTAYSLRQNYPNPFNSATTIEYALAGPGRVVLEIFTPSGQKIATLMDGDQSAGVHTAVWDASGYSNGVYLCRITAGEYRETIKMLYMK
jgi:hypothetical protein